jgi:hypothetical protein
MLGENTQGIYAALVPSTTLLITLLLRLATMYNSKELLNRSFDANQLFALCCEGRAGTLLLFCVCYIY